jgi:redox-sensing transcriptional repressor
MANVYSASDQSMGKLYILFNHHNEGSIMAKTNRPLSISTIQRFPRYLLHLQTLIDQNIEWISSKELATALGLTSSTVRQDLSYLDSSGISKRGYEVALLETSLRKAIGITKQINAVIIGAGNLGTAIALHKGFNDYNFNIISIFDADPNVIGKKIGPYKIQSVNSIKKVIVERNIEIGIITVPFHAAPISARVPGRWGRPPPVPLPRMRLTG